MKKVAIILFAVILISSTVLTGCSAYRTKPNETYHFEEIESFAKVYDLYYKNKLPPGIINILIAILYPILALKFIYVKSLLPDEKLDPASHIVRSVYCDELSGILYVGTGQAEYIRLK